MSNELRTKFKESKSSKHLVSLTNPDDSAATTVSDDWIDDAIDDVKKDFLVYAWVALDQTDATHLQIGVDGVYIHILEKMGSGTDLSAKFKEYQGELFKLSQITPRTRTISKIDYDA